MRKREGLGRRCLPNITLSANMRGEEEGGAGEEMSAKHHIIS